MKKYSEASIVEDIMEVPTVKEKIKGGEVLYSRETCYQRTQALGMSREEVIKKLRKIFPNEKWLCIEVNDSSRIKFSSCIGGFARFSDEKNGKIGEWNWEWVETEEFENTFLADVILIDLLRNWTGILKVTRETGENFLIVSRTDARARVGEEYIISTRDTDLFFKFIEEVQPYFFEEEDGVRVISNLRDFTLRERDVEERVFLPKEIEEDLYENIYTFFEKKEMYEKLNIPYKRGFLLIGSPGNGKTSLIKKIIMKIHKKYGSTSYLFQINREINEAHLAAFIQLASEEEIPGVVFIEDIESMTLETGATRSGLLNVLDGVSSLNNVLIIATTNNPQHIDPALLQRPSRFDRIWYFKLPDEKMRFEYLEHYLSHLNKSLLMEIAKDTKNWSYAYLKELRFSASIFALKENREEVEDQDLRDAFRVLSLQFRSGNKAYDIEESDNKVGFF